MAQQKHSDLKVQLYIKAAFESRLISIARRGRHRRNFSKHVAKVMREILSGARLVNYEDLNMNVLALPPPTIDSEKTTQ